MANLVAQGRQLNLKTSRDDLNQDIIETISKDGQIQTPQMTNRLLKRPLTCRKQPNSERQNSNRAGTGELEGQKPGWFDPLKDSKEQKVTYNVNNLIETAEKQKIINLKSQSVTDFKRNDEILALGIFNNHQIQLMSTDHMEEKYSEKKGKKSDHN